MAPAAVSARLLNMDKIIRGTYEVTQPKVDLEVESTEDTFEREARSRLGGSIAFVSKKTIRWDLLEGQDD